VFQSSTTNLIQFFLAEKLLGKPTVSRFWGQHTMPILIEQQLRVIFPSKFSNQPGDSTWDTNSWPRSWVSTLGQAIYDGNEITDLGLERWTEGALCLFFDELAED
jgi:hypothetical protein